MRISDWSSDVCSSDLELHRGAEKYRSLFDSIEAGFCIIEMIFDDAGKPVDYRFIETNPAFARHTGLSDAVGKSMRRSEARRVGKEGVCTCRDRWAPYA